MSEEWKTSMTLISRAKNPNDTHAWTDFVKYYENFIYHILIRMNINVADSDDLVQEILLKLWKNLNTYNPRLAKFRTWLGRVVRNAAYDYFSSIKSRRKLMEKEQDIANVLHKTSQEDMEKLVEDEWMAYLTSFALDRMRGIFSGQAVEVFSMSLDGVAAEEISEKLGISRDSVYTLKNRVKSRLIKEVHAMMKEMEFK